MRYRVAFAKSGQSDGGEPAIQPSAEFDANFSDGVIAEKVFVEALESEAWHSQEVMDEDDAFLGMAAAEVWEYDVADARADEFEYALNRSDYVLEYDVVDASVTETVDAIDDAAREADADVEMAGGENTEDASESGSGVRSGDDGPAGMPTGDPSAGGLGRGELNGDEGLEDLTVRKANDRGLGLTNRGKTAPHDWAANTGPTRNPGRGVETDNVADEESTLAPKRR